MRISLSLLLIVAAAVPACRESSELAIFGVPGTDRSIVVERRIGHASLSEYRRRVLLREGSETLDEAILLVDTGGYSRVNVYRTDDSTLVLRDADASYSVAVAAGTITRESNRYTDRTFLGSFDVDTAGRWRFISVSERPELPTEFRGR